ncbi:MAG: homoserine dehydrogenase [Ruminococcus sp.]|uniref:homoserine dehydrogenase n=1 Tax=uncultured Ruminococcus sp. TaxID=165186 RepID=UPI00258DAC88|nr:MULTISPECIES: homoserine dehydrogenase [Ruminococcus]MCI5598941.1 homoserine dehydrogenase [Ruminococcus sp.]MCI5616803.1 homoserine dehydrogenase [Ruminococcus sp.]MCI6505333.1 homoserine dehydrogenase [Ruminococcus sp.]MDD5890207.1 homoserine dehydrogenase [Ruminococcus sp.]MDD6709659.1 homoserine dehydrogenase [Ruminococcus sp.]
MISVAIMGHGTVGSGVAEILTTHKQKLFKAVGEELYVKHILDLREFPDSPLADRFTKNFEDIVNDIEVRVVVEVMGGTNPAYDFVKRCLQAGKSVVTSNKELVAKHGAELLAVAKENNANFLFEASVGGGIPIIRPLSQCLVANEVDEIAGILNGTTNFIFGKMINDNMDFSDALKLAQDLGYAERNPEADIEGHDACRKICILASLAFGKHIYPDNVYTKGISEITLDDVKYADSLNYVIKLIGDVKKTEDGKLDIMVAPMLLSKDCILSDINDVFNGILVKGDCTGDVMFYGKGAGKLPTASAVVADVVDCAKHLKARKRIFWTDSDGSQVASYKDSKTAMYIRVAGKGEMAQSLFPDSEIMKADGNTVLMTQEYKFGEIEEKIAKLNENGEKVLSAIRIGNL